jgi:hypothetical protein
LTRLYWQSPLLLPFSERTKTLQVDDDDDDKEYFIFLFATLELDPDKQSSIQMRFGDGLSYYANWRGGR